MANGIMSLVLASAIGSGPYHHGRYQVPVTVHGPVVHHQQFATGSPGDVLYPYDQQDPWLHGYYQEIPNYGGYAAFRPYNYKHVLSQRHAAQGWGISPIMPYSHHWWKRYAAQTDLSNQSLAK